MHQQGIIRTKLLTPRSGEQALARERLFQAMEAGLAKRLVLVCAPAGFGKTTLVTSWINTGEYSNAWISLDERDRNLHGFLSYLWEACLPFIPETAEVMIAGLSGQKEVSAEGNSTRLINALAELDARLTLVLDDYHTIENPDIHEFVRLIIQDAPPQLNLIITTRSDPPLQLAKLRAKSDLQEIRSIDLVFNETELKDFIGNNSSLVFSDEHLRQLHEKTEGWITAARLALLSISSERDIPAFIEAFSGTDRHIMDYLMEEVLHHLDQETQDFLFKTSIVERFHASLCDHIMDWTRSQSILEELEKQNLFIVPLDNQRKWFRYHPLIAQILQHRLENRQTDEIPGLHLKVSAWFREEGNISEAIYHANEVGDVDLISELVREHGGRMLQEARLVELSEWFDMLDEKTIHQDSVLLSHLSWTLLLMGDLAGARNCLEQIEKNPIQESDLENIPASVAAIEAYLALFTGDPAKAIAAANKALSLYKDDDHDSISVVAFILGSALSMAGKTREAMAAHERATHSAEIAGSIHIELPARNARIVLEGLQGHFSVARAEYEEILKRYSGAKSPPPPIALTHLGLADLLVDHLELSEAARHAEEGMGIAKRWGNSEGMIHAELILLVVHVVLGKLAKAREAANRINALLEKRGHQYHRMANVHGVFIHLARAEGGTEAARDYLEKHNLGLHGKPMQQRMMEYFAEITVLIEEGSHQQAIDNAKQLIGLCQAGDKHVFTHILNLLCASALAQSGDEVHALEYLEKALPLAVEEKIYRPFLLVYPHLRSIVKRLGKKDEQLSAFLARIELESSTTGLMDTEDGLVERLSKREMEVLRLLPSGLSNEDMAKQLFVSLATVKTHLRHIYAKLEVKNRTSAVERARQLGLV